jgi:hypothetical protein
MIRSFEVLRVNSNVVGARTVVEAEESGPWQARSRLQDLEGLSYLAGLFATSSEPVDLELEVVTDDPRPRMKGRARIVGVPLDLTGEVRFEGVGPLEHPEDA